MRAEQVTPLQHFFAPEAVAVIGASTKPGKVGHDLLGNLIKAGFQGAIHPINPHATEVLGRKAYASVKDVEGPVDLAVIAVPAPLVAEVMEECGDKGVDSAVVISAGFKESGAEGLARERQLAEIAARRGIRVVGPNCLGVISTGVGLDASFAPSFPKRGRIAVMSQSGALATAIIDWSVSRGIGFSKFVSIGNSMDVGVVDLLRAWEDDPETKVIVAYVEGLSDGPEFIRVAREVSAKKPIIVVKSGSTQAGARAVASHTGSLAGSERAYDAAFLQSGVIRAHSIEDLFDYAVAFAYQDLPRSRRVAILTNAGGPGIMATDELERAGLELAPIDPATVDRLRTQLPPASGLYNPVDCLGDADAERYTFAAAVLLADVNVDAMIALLTPQTTTQPLETAQGLARAQARSNKPVLSAFMGGLTMQGAIEHLAAHQVPCYSYPERAIDSLAAMTRYREWCEQPTDEPSHIAADTERVRAIFQAIRAEGRLVLGETEAREVLIAYDIAMPDYRLATSAEQAVQCAEEIGFPVVLKIVSPDILHKSDIGGVKLGVEDAQQAMDAFELMMLRAGRFMPDAALRGVSVQQMVRTGREVIVGANHDPQFGPLVMFGLGGIYVEVLGDVSFRVAPFGERHARQMIDEVKSATLLRGTRGEKPADIDAVVKTLLTVSQMVMDFPEIVEMDVNPLKVGEPGAGAIAVDARIIIAE